jgi:hypothetical protein
LTCPTSESVCVILKRIIDHKIRTVQLKNLLIKLAFVGRMLLENLRETFPRKDGKGGRGQSLPRPLLSSFQLLTKFFESPVRDTNSPITAKPIAPKP